MGIPWSFKRNFTGAKEIKDTNDYLSKVGRAIGSLDSMPVGFNMPWWSDTLPSNKYMFMEGQSLASYPEARAVFGDYLPDLRGRVLVHKSTDSTVFPTDAIKATGGSRYMQAHAHIGRRAAYTSYWASGGEQGGVTVSGTEINTSTTGAGNSENLQPYIVCRFIAKVLP